MKWVGLLAVVLLSLAACPIAVPAVGPWHPTDIVAETLLSVFCLALIAGALFFYFTRLKWPAIFEVGDTAIRLFARGTLQCEILYGEVNTIEGRFHGGDGDVVTNNKPNPVRASVWIIYGSSGQKISFGQEVTGLSLMKAMLAERIAPQFVPQDWQRSREFLASRLDPDPEM